LFENEEMSLNDDPLTDVNEDGRGNTKSTKYFALLLEPNPASTTSYPEV
jgi:hypothetical protein